jgi:hypothetical protein
MVAGWRGVGGGGEERGILSYHSYVQTCLKEYLDKGVCPHNFAKNISFLDLQKIAELEFLNNLIEARNRVEIGLSDSGPA